MNEMKTIINIGSDKYKEEDDIVLRLNIEYDGEITSIDLTLKELVYCILKEALNNTTGGIK